MTTSHYTEWRMRMITQRSHDEGDIFVGPRFYGAGSVGTVEERCRLGDVHRVLVVTYRYNVKLYV